MSIIHPIDNLITLARQAERYDAHPSGANRALLQIALRNIGSAEKAANDLRDLSASINRLAAAIGYPGPDWDSQGFPDLAAALVGYEARCKLAPFKEAAEIAWQYRADSNLSPEEMAVVVGIKNTILGGVKS